MTISAATNQREWDAFLTQQQFRPFLQSWAMGEVYRRIGQEPVRLMVKDGDAVRGICFAHVVPARRGRHLSIPYGPVLEMENVLDTLMNELKRIAREHRCSFVRMSPFWVKSAENEAQLKDIGAMDSPLHLLAEHLWYLPLTQQDVWSPFSTFPARPAGGHSPFSITPRTEEELLKDMRATTRNLIRRAQKEGVTVAASADPAADLHHFLTLHDETRKRHGFTPYTDSFFRAQVEEFAKTGGVTLYLARHQGQVIASSIHMHMGGETSYHHGASVISKIPANYLLQWTAIQDAMRRGDHVYNFWGIAPGRIEDGERKIGDTKHPFSGVTLFKTGFGGTVLELTHCRDVPLSPRYYVTRGFENVRKWRRGF